MTIIKNTNGGGLKSLVDSVSTLVSREVFIGVPSSKNDSLDGNFNLASLAAVHEFGGTIKHGGGTRYQKNANGNLAKFVRGDFVGPTSGVTKAHAIKIPERSFLRASLIEHSDDLAKNISEGINHYVKNKKPIDDEFFQKLGTMSVNIVKQYMVTASFTPLAKSTIKKKGSSKPLIDTGNLRQSITYEVR